jgi:hypothetical protein
MLGFFARIAYLVPIALLQLTEMFTYTTNCLATMFEAWSDLFEVRTEYLYDKLILKMA